MSKEKIYYEEGPLSVSSSRVVLVGIDGKEENIVLRNISSVRVNSQSDGNGFAGKGCGGFLIIAGLGAFTAVDGGDDIALGLAFILIGAAMMYFLKNKTTYYVGITAGAGTWTNYVTSDTDEKPKKIVEAINSALLDLDKYSRESQSSTSNSENSSLDEIKKLKELLDSGIITQEEFDLKKKELLGL